MLIYYGYSNAIFGAQSLVNGSRQNYVIDVDLNNDDELNGVVGGASEDGY